MSEVSNDCPSALLYSGGSWGCLPTAGHWVLAQKVPGEFQGTLIKITQPAHLPTAQVTPGALAKLSSTREISLSPGKKNLRLVRLGREDRWGTCCLSEPAGYRFNNNTRKAQGEGVRGGGNDDDYPCCLRDQLIVTPLVKRKLLRKVRAPPPSPMTKGLQLMRS